MALTGIDIDECTTGAALPGLGTFQYLPVDELDETEWEDAILAATYNLQKAVFASNWYTMPYAPGSGSWTEDQQDSEQGLAFRVSIGARLPADSPTVRGELNRMRQHRYILKLTRNGAVLIIGTPEQPLRFESRFESGAEAGDNRSHRITFTGTTTQKAPGYVPVF